MTRILLIEDEIGAIAALKRSLARAGFEVLVATNLPDALSATENQRPEAVLIAAGLQGEPATTLVEAIRGVDLIRPVIVMGDGSGTGEPSVPKPVDAARLIELLRELVPSAAQAEEPEVAAVLAAAVPELPPDEPADDPPPAAIDLMRRRELAARALAEAQARRRAAEAARMRPTPPDPVAEARPETRPEVRPEPRPEPRVAPAAPAIPPPVDPETSWAESTAPEAPLPAPPAAPASLPVRPPAARPPARPVPHHDDTVETAVPPAVARAEPAPLPAPPLAPPVAAAKSSLDAELFGDLSTESVRPAVRPAAPLDLRPPPEPPKREPPPKPVFPPPELAEWHIATAGSLDKLEPAALLVACHRARLTGQLRFEQGAVQRTLFFADGRLSGAASTSPEERLEQLSYRRGLITREQQRLLRTETQVPTRRLALLMVERSYLKPAELFPLVQERVEEVIYEACGAFAGSYQLLPEPVPDDERVALSRSPLALATEGIRRKYLMERLLAGLGGPSTLLRPAQVRGPELSDYGLTARERRLAQSVDGLRNIEELLFESGIEPLPGLKILFALLLGRSVEMAVRGLTNDQTPELEAKIDLGRVAEKYEQVRSSNYFEVLGVGREATAYEIEQAYERLAREFQPARFHDLRRPELPGQLDEIARVLAEARDILVDAGLREEYRAHLRR